MTNLRLAGEAAQDFLDEHDLDIDDLVSFSVDPWRVTLHTKEAIPGVEYDSALFDTAFVHTACADVIGGQLKLIYVTKGKVVPA